ncbi:hypothetical protein SAMN05192529_12818 [Arachidicoccus rhizosphaerae]|jgi:uncharacterized protein (TIGR00730 family)|uniref:Cytokinin riboside 5'-monophosphate phosphoribohydrolase n=1 Tax=Arachidicoccus rhizosphaerae TaxID=551991 RepID=A0A1H4C6Q0_9BACT|nr:TIGR00730 family Rossman fold protein [Arachidicoccus rhizosphaerae]SEA56081.1 hypothetical protein SAMN05192529_12818 [Arachidicoccus rhizosphaerae]
MQLQNITVFCGSSSGQDNIYMEQAYALGTELAKRGIGLIYGGAKVGLMGAVANGVLEYHPKGKAVGVIPGFLKSVEIAHEHLTTLIVVDTMHQRKAKMDALSDGIIALPGGFGTMEELFEMLTWGQLGLHKKPVGILNTAGFYDELIALCQKMVDKGFLKKQNQDMLLVDTSINGLLDKMQRYEAPIVGKWIQSEEDSLKDKM